MDNEPKSEPPSMQNLVEYQKWLKAKQGGDAPKKPAPPVQVKDDKKSGK